MNIKRGDFVTLNTGFASTYGRNVWPAGTKCRVCKAQRDGMLTLSVVGNQSSIYVANTSVTKAESPAPKVKVGDIFVSHWGYEQTNVDFYRVVELTKKSLRYVPLKALRRYTGPMEGTSLPDLTVKGLDGVTKTALIRVDYKGEVHFKLTSYSHAWKWGGSPETFTEYH